MFKARGIITLAVAALLLFSYHAYASSHIARFVFITEPQTLAPGVPSEAITIQSQSADGTSVKVDRTACFHMISTSSSGEFSSNKENWQAVSVVTMSKSTGNRTFYYRDSGSGSHTLTVQVAEKPDDAASCPSWPVEEWNVGWDANQTTVITGGAESAGAGETPDENAVRSSSSASSGGVSAPFQPTIKAYAGEDRTVVAGALTYFNASASDEKNEPFENARFWWNFGDGAAEEGRSVTHIFAATGAYIVGLHVSSGASSASDYLTVNVIPNKVAVIGVTTGAAGFVRLKNPSEYVVDISGWHMSDASGRTFTLLPHTKLNARSEIAFPNSITGLLHDGDTVAVLYYPNGIRASDYSGSAVADSVGSGNVQGARQTAPRDAAHTAPTAEIKTKQRDPEDIPAKIVAPSEVSGKTELAAELAQASAPVRPSRALFLWIAAGLSALAAGGFLLVKTIIMRNHE